MDVSGRDGRRSHFFHLGAAPGSVEGATGAAPIYRAALRSGDPNGSGPIAGSDPSEHAGLHEPWHPAWDRLSRVRVLCFVLVRSQPDSRCFPHDRASNPAVETAAPDSTPSNHGLEPPRAFYSMDE